MVWSLCYESDVGWGSHRTSAGESENLSLKSGAELITDIYSHLSSFFFLVSWDGMRLSPLGTSAINWPIVPAPDDRWWWVWSGRWNENWQVKPKYADKTYPSATLSTTNPTWPPDLDSNPGHRGGKPATNRLSYGTALRHLPVAVQPW
jgi:hypothetical protein